MMDLTTVTEAIQGVIAGSTLALWTGYRIQAIPFAIYDDAGVQYIGHPNPPETRPANLMAATSVDINGVETATIPVAYCPDENTAVAIAYHEGFHVFQHHHFVPLTADMFTAMAFYPGLDPAYRALCRLEADVLRRDDLSAAAKLKLLGPLFALHRTKLNRHPSLADYERFLERSEGTAYYVEQRARKLLYGSDPVLGEVGYGWGHFYQTGSAVCWLLAETIPDWQQRIEAGAAPGDLVIEYGGSGEPDLPGLGYADAYALEVAAVEQFKTEIAADLDPLEAPDVIRIRYQSGGGPVYRAFNPTTLVLTGDGRILHRTFLKLLLPGRGSIAADIPVIDHVVAGEVILPGTVEIPHLIDGKLRLESNRVQVELDGVEQIAPRSFALAAPLT